MQLAESILQPERLRAGEESLKPEAIRLMWPREVAEKSFIDYLWSQYDYTQLGAIEVRPIRRSGPAGPRDTLLCLGWCYRQAQLWL